MAKNKQATIIDVKEMLKPQKRTLPKSWIKAAGLLKQKNEFFKISKANSCRMGKTF